MPMLAIVLDFLMIVFNFYRLGRVDYILDGLALAEKVGQSIPEELNKSLESEALSERRRSWFWIYWFTILMIISIVTGGYAC